MSTQHYEISRILPDAMQTGESPLWQPQEGALYWVDIPAKTVHRWHAASGAHSSWLMSSDAACIALAARGGLIVALRTGFVHLDTTSGAITEIASVPYDTSRVRCNDGKCDAKGRFWVGTMYEPRDQQLGEMLCLERGKVRTVWSGGMTVANGLVFSDDHSLLYHADTTSHTIRRFPLDFEAGTVDVAQMSVLKTFSSDKQNNYGGRPDGAALDVDGNYWCAMFEGGRILCLSPSGEILRDIALPVRCPTMLAFGGDDLRTLYITSASHGRSASELAQYPWSGCVLALRVDVAGKFEPSYLD
ncbi:MAG: SMP-30/gluconolactonase/LRE family protein [Burkholderiales bacterium]|nr:SMP-30/gluconolactonase/LRE family protein [Burkholderiales bacterium]